MNTEWCAHTNLRRLICRCAWYMNTLWLMIWGYHWRNSHWSWNHLWYRRGCLQISVWKVTLEGAVGPVAMLPKILVVAEPMLVFVASESSCRSLAPCRWSGKSVYCVYCFYLWCRSTILYDILNWLVMIDVLTFTFII